MVRDFPGARKDSNIIRFITSGKPGGCFLCEHWVEKLEAHHLSYSPEVIAHLCHMCHHTVHFWPNRLSDDQKLKLLRLRFSENKSWIILEETKNNVQALAKLIAPSRSKFVRAQQIAEIKRIKPAKPIKEIKRLQPAKQINEIKHPWKKKK